MRLARPDPQTDDSVNICVRASRAWRAYLLRVAESERITVSSLIDRAVEAYARASQLAEMPPKR